MSMVKVPVISARSYLTEMVRILRENEGVLTTSGMEARIEYAFSDQFTSADRRRLKRKNRLKWQNMLDWAKAAGSGEGILRTVRVKQEGRWMKYIVLLDQNVTPEDWYNLALATPRPKGFQKTCPRCKEDGLENGEDPSSWMVPLALLKCHCGYVFPSKAPRRDIHPDGEEL
jgi:hypothetical protein